MVYDVVVIGGGPAGATAGYYSALAGAKTLIIERKTELGTPVRCGEAVMWLPLKIIGLNYPESNAYRRTQQPLWVSNQIRGLKITTAGGKVVKLDTKLEQYTGVILDRAEFERMLIARAVRVGAELMLGKTAVKVRVEDGKIGLQTTGKDIGSEVQGKIIIGADGVESLVGRKAGLTHPLSLTELGITVQYLVEGVTDCEPDILEGYIGTRYIPRGYVWLFPKSRERRMANIGLGLFGGVPPETRRQLQQLRRSGLLDYLYNFIKWRCPEAEPIRFIAGCLPLTLPPARTVRKRVMIVGDSARMVNCAAGAGIGNALYSGKLAGELAGKIITEQKPLRELNTYDWIWRQRFEARLRRSYRLGRLLYYGSENRLELVLAMLNLIFKLNKLIPKAFARSFCKLLYF